MKEEKQLDSARECAVKQNPDLLFLVEFNYFL